MRNFTKDLLLNGAEYKENPKIKEVNNSMELDTCELASFKNTVNGILFQASLKVQGKVNVDFKGQTYHCASQMPKELLDCYHNGTYPENLDPEYCVDANNWFEMTISILRNDKILHNENYIIDELSRDDDWKNIFAANTLIALQMVNV